VKTVGGRGRRFLLSDDGCIGVVGREARRGRPDGKNSHDSVGNFEQDHAEDNLETLVSQSIGPFLGSG
jgi:hypothetical protein